MAGFEVSTYGRIWVSTEERYTGKHEWGLSIEHDRSILDASREQRIAALNHIPSLVAKLTAEAQARLDAILQAKELLKK